MLKIIRTLLEKIGILAKPANDIPFHNIKLSDEEIADLRRHFSEK